MRTRTCSRSLRRNHVRLEVEPLEARTVLSTGWTGVVPLPEAEPNDIVEVSGDLGTVTAGEVREASGTVGNSPAGGADVDWYRFTLVDPARVMLATLAPDEGLAVDAVLSLYRGDLAELPVQALADAAGSASLTRTLPAGDYYVAVSGAGNRYFHPHLADSGYVGDAGDYQLQLTVTAAEPDASLDWVPSFQVDAVEAAIGETANDTPAGAHELGELTDGVLVQQTGVIGDDPSYDLSYEMPGAEIDLYHFHVSGSGLYRFQAELFAGRIGSSLDPGVSLFRLDPADGLLHLVAANDNTDNLSTFGEGMTWPLYTDSALFAGLTEGDYYVAVSASGNTPDPDLGLQPGPDYGIFDPNIPHSGLGGYSTGAYVLNFRLQADDAAPQVASTSIAEGATLDGPPTRLVIDFDETVDLRQLAHRSYLWTGQSRVDAVFVRGADGIDYYPRLRSYDATINEATFLMYDGLPRGLAELHLSGLLGLTDLAGQPLTGNDPSGDYVVHFTVAGLERGRDGDPLHWSSQGADDSLEHPQDLGPLFANELTKTVDGQIGIAISRDFTAAPQLSPADSADYFRFEVLQSATYLVTWSGTAGPAGTRPVVFTANGELVTVNLTTTGNGVIADLIPGTYVVRVDGWAPGTASGDYELRISTLFSAENPTPLTDGPGPALRLRLLGLPPVPPPVEESPPVVVLPPPVGEAPPVVMLPPPVVEAPPVVELPSSQETTPGVSPSAPGASKAGAPLGVPVAPSGVLLAMSAGPVGGVLPATAGDAAAHPQAVQMPNAAPTWVAATVGRVLGALNHLAQPVPNEKATLEDPEAAGGKAEEAPGLALLPGIDEVTQYLQHVGETALAPLANLGGRWMAMPPVPGDPGEPTVVPTMAEEVPMGELSMRNSLASSGALILAALAMLLLLPPVDPAAQEGTDLQVRGVRS